MMDDEGPTMEQFYRMESALKDKHTDLIADSDFVLEFAEDNNWLAAILLKILEIDIEDKERLASMARILRENLNDEAARQAEQYVNDHPEIWL